MHIVHDQLGPVAMLWVFAVLTEIQCIHTEIVDMTVCILERSDLHDLNTFISPYAVVAEGPTSGKQNSFISLSLRTELG